jgi:hypothetical protein
MKPTKLSHIAFASTFIAFLASDTLAAPLGTAFNYQGRLADGSTPANGIYDLSFSLVDSPSGGSQFVITVVKPAITVTNGMFSVLLDFGASEFNGNAVWLDISVRTNGSGPYTTLSPRQPLTPTPYALTASNLSGTLPAARLTGTAPSNFLSGTYSGALTFNNPANTFTGNGSSLTGVDAATLSGYNFCNLPCYWNLSGNPNTTPGLSFLGTSDNKPLELKVNNQRALRLEPTVITPNIIGGHAGNYAFSNSVGVTIAGGGAPGAANFADAPFNAAATNVPDFGVIAGGAGNQIFGSPYSVIGGGFNNTNSGPYSVITGGGSNFAGATYAAVGGGWKNFIRSNSAYGTIAGGYGNTLDQGSVNSSISGGRFNAIVASTQSTIGGGEVNGINADQNYGPYQLGPYRHNVIGGGGTNYLQVAFGCVIAGGAGNSMWAEKANPFYYCTIGGGNDNHMSNSSKDQTGSTIAGGQHNRIGGGLTPSSDGGTISGGVYNQVLAYHGTIGGGYSNRVLSLTVNPPLGLGPTIAGGEFNSAGDAGTISGGRYNTVGEVVGTIPGGMQAKTRSFGQLAYASGEFATPGDAQTSIYVCRNVSTDSVQTNLYLDGGSSPIIGLPASSYRIIVPTNSTWTFEALVTGRATDGTSAAFRIAGAIKNNAGTTSIMGSPTKTIVAADDPSWDATAVADVSKQALVIQVIGANGTTIRWVASVRTSEVVF